MLLGVERIEAISVVVKCNNGSIGLQEKEGVSVIGEDAYV